MAQWTIMVVIVVCITAIVVIVTFVLIYWSNLDACGELYSQFTEKQETYNENLTDYNQRLQGYQDRVNTTADIFNRDLFLERHRLDDSILKLTTEKARLNEDYEKLNARCPPV